MSFLIKNKKVKLIALGINFLLIMMILFLGASFSTNEALLQRLQLMKAAKLMIKMAPLGGLGLNNFIFHLPEFWPLTGFTYWLQPVHNIYLLIMAESGFTGILIFVWFLILTYRRLFQALFLPRRQAGVNNFPLIISLTVILLLSLVDHYWITLQQTQLFLAVILGLVWSSKM
jgi:O-antigen ligase